MAVLDDVQLIAAFRSVFACIDDTGNRVLCDALHIAIAPGVDGMKVFLVADEWIVFGYRSVAMNAKIFPLGR